MFGSSCCVAYSRNVSAPVVPGVSRTGKINALDTVTIMDIP